MQDFVYERKYDCVWIQWCALYLTDIDLIDFFKRTADNLKTTEETNSKGEKKCGLIFVKENVMEERFQLDRDDHSITRTRAQLELIFEKSDLEIVRQFYQPGFPKELFPISCYVLKKKD